MSGHMAELADAQDSGSCVRKDVGVQVPLCPPNFCGQARVTFAFGFLGSQNSTSIVGMNSDFKSFDATEGTSQDPSVFSDIPQEVSVRRPDRSSLVGTDAFGTYALQQMFEEVDEALFGLGVAEHERQRHVAQGAFELGMKYLDRMGDELHTFGNAVRHLRDEVRVLKESGGSDGASQVIGHLTAFATTSRGLFHDLDIAQNEIDHVFRTKTFVKKVNPY